MGLANRVIVLPNKDEALWDGLQHYGIDYSKFLQLLKLGECMHSYDRDCYAITIMISANHIAMVISTSS